MRGGRGCGPGWEGPSGSNAPLASGGVPGEWSSGQEVDGASTSSRALALGGTRAEGPLIPAADSCAPLASIWTREPVLDLPDLRSQCPGPTSLLGISNPLVNRLN